MSSGIRRLRAATGSAIQRQMSRGRRLERGRDEEEERNGDENGEEEEECPVCRETFSRRRTKTFAFACGGGRRHCICSECNRRMFDRHDDACPMCRAPRCDQAVMGYRPPAPFHEADFPFSEALEIVDELFFGQGAEQQSGLGGRGGRGGRTGRAGRAGRGPDGPNVSVIHISPGSHPFMMIETSAGGRRGGHLFVPRRAGQQQQQQQQQDAEEGEEEERQDRVVNSILRDPVVQAAIDGLRNPQRGGIRGFLSNVRSAAASRRQSRPR